MWVTRRFGQASRAMGFGILAEPSRISPKNYELQHQHQAPQLSHPPPASPPCLRASVRTALICHVQEPSPQLREA